jgi:hypothetical protein
MVIDQMANTNTTSRRSFIGASAAVAAALFAPKISLRSEIDRERLMLPFCAAWDYCRFDIDSPFGVDAFTYATDSRRMVRAEIANRCEVGERRIPNVTSLWQTLWLPSGEFRPFERPAVESLGWKCRQYNICPACGGRRVPWDGVGEIYPSNEAAQAMRIEGRDYDVDDNTTLDPACELCRGKTYDGPSLLKIGSSLFSAAMLLPLWDLPGLKIALREPMLDSFRRQTISPLLFTADGFEGAVMPCTPKTTDLVRCV